MSQDTKQQFSKLTVFFHWAVALTIISLLSVGVYMEEFKAYFLYKYHKSIGILIFLVIIGRIIWRIKNGWPIPLNTQHANEQKLAKLVHWVLIIGTLTFPLSGMMMSALGGHGLPMFGLELFPANYVDGKAIPINKELAQLGGNIHYWLGWTMIVTIVIHITGALKHHFVYKDGTLRRMLGKRVDD